MHCKKIGDLCHVVSLYALLWLLRGLLAMRTASQTFRTVTGVLPATARTPERTRRRWALDESGEGVISAAIAVLVMAFLGVAMWFAFSAMLTTTTNNISHTITKIGQ